MSSYNDDLAAAQHRTHAMLRALLNVDQAINGYRAVAYGPPQPPAQPLQEQQGQGEPKPVQAANGAATGQRSIGETINSFPPPQGQPAQQQRAYVSPVGRKPGVPDIEERHAPAPSQRTQPQVAQTGDATS